MSIRVLFFASLADISGAREISVDAGGFADVNSVFKKVRQGFSSAGELTARLCFSR